MLCTHVEGGIFCEENSEWNVSLTLEVRSQVFGHCVFRGFVVHVCMPVDQASLCMTQVS